VGARSAGASDAEVETLRRFGEITGTAFQTKDDLFDFEKSLRTGKPAGVDLRESKMTLPLIHALAGAGGQEKRRIINRVKNGGDEKGVAEVMAFVAGGGGVEYARRKMAELQQAAFDLVAGYADSPYKRSLMNLVRFTTERDH
jgi:octaprenyl-diphosphate synthase